MKRISLNRDWLFASGTITMMELFTGCDGGIQSVNLPHDAMIHRERTKDTKNAHQTGFYPGGEYTYVRRWEVPVEWQDQRVVLEFEGVADTCRVYFNGELIAVNYNPYTGIFADVTDKLNFGAANEIKVEVCSVEQSSRWYSGAGIYRPVCAWVGGPVAIAERGLKLLTLEADAETAVIEARIPLRNESHASRRIQVKVSLMTEDGRIAASETAPVTLPGNTIMEHREALTVVEPMLWSDDAPNLYTCILQIMDGDTMLDEHYCPFGIRTFSLNAKKGLLLNGKPVKLRGSCIHHDNGVIGAATFYDAEYRRCKQMKEAGFNALRSSHHPMSKAMLKACDRLGMLVMDELSDIWTRTKNQHDYANYFPTFWQRDVAELVEKDYNHPCVILYSTGNEIPEAGTPFGADWNRRIDGEFKRLDPTRYTTSGINGLMAGAARMGEIMAQAMGVSAEELAAMQQPEGTESRGERGGADEVNDMAQIMVGPLADAIATSPILEEMIGEFAAVNDIAGYNYLTALHEEDHLRHPNRVVLGTETFPADIVHLWDVVTRNAHVLGDFTWTGYDYLGEAGCGVFHYDGGLPFSSHWPDRLANIGDIDILGTRKPISHLRQAVYGLSSSPSIGVTRMNRTGQRCATTPWMWKDNIESWTWTGHEGETAQVDVYANAQEVELFLNGASLGRKPVEGYIAGYEVPYAAGSLTAVSYIGGAEVCRSELKTAGSVDHLQIAADRAELTADGESLTFVKIRLMDSEGNWNRQEKRKVTVSLEGDMKIQGFGSADPSCEGSYQDETWSTYDGEVMAVLRSGTRPGKARLTVKAEGLDAQTVTFTQR